MNVRRAAVLAFAFVTAVGPARSGAACDLEPLSCRTGPIGGAGDVAASVGGEAGEAGEVVEEAGEVVEETGDAIRETVDGLTTGPIPEPPSIEPPGTDPGGADPGPGPGRHPGDGAPPAAEHGGRVAVAGGDRSLPGTPPGAAPAASPASRTQGPLAIASHGPRPPAGIGRVVLDALPSAAAAVALFALAVVFAAAQTRIDRRDPRLALAPAFEDEVEFR